MESVRERHPLVGHRHGGVRHPAADPLPEIGRLATQLGWIVGKQNAWRYPRLAHRLYQNEIGMTRGQNELLVSQSPVHRGHQTLVSLLSDGTLSVQDGHHWTSRDNNSGWFHVYKPTIVQPLERLPERLAWAAEYLAQGDANVPALDLVAVRDDLRRLVEEFGELIDAAAKR